MTTREKVNEVVRWEIDLAWWDWDDDILSYDWTDAILVTNDWTTPWTAVWHQKYSSWLLYTYSWEVLETNNEEDIIFTYDTAQSVTWTKI